MLPYAEAMREFLEAVQSAVPLGNSYPSDANALVRLKLNGAEHITTALGAAIWRGERTQIEAYLAGGADINRPIWYKAAENPPVMSSAAHMAINAVFMKQAPADFFEYVLLRGADANALETMYNGDETHPTLWSQSSVLFHTATSEKHALVASVLQHGVKDIDAGGISVTGTMTPLFASVMRRDVEAVKLLLANGADPSRGTVTTIKGNKSALKIAEEMIAFSKIDSERRQSEAIVTALRAIKLTDSSPK